MDMQQHIDRIIDSIRPLPEEDQQSGIAKEYVWPSLPERVKMLLPKRLHFAMLDRHPVTLEKLDEE